MSPTPRRTAIRAGWIIAFDGRGHRLLRDGVVVVEGDPALSPPVGKRHGRAAGVASELRAPSARFTAEAAAAAGHCR